MQKSTRLNPINLMEEGATEESEKPTPLETLIAKNNASYFFFSGPIDFLSAEKFIKSVEKLPKGKSIGLVFTTYGGDAGAAYRMARCAKAHTGPDGKLILYVFGYCKSAGTLFALGADEIVMGSRGEFGPLDVQMIKPDEFTEHTSGLDISMAIDELGDHAFKIFERHLLGLKERSGGAITTKTAAEIASAVAVGLLSPITEQIDPIRLGETQRAMKIAHQYGVKLGADEKLLAHLTEDYPTHDFVIDFSEAKTLFKCIRETDELEKQFEKDLRVDLRAKTGMDAVTLQAQKVVLGPLKPVDKAKPVIQKKETNETPAGFEPKPHREGADAPPHDQAQGNPSPVVEQRKVDEGSRSEAATEAENRA